MKVAAAVLLVIAVVLAWLLNAEVATTKQLSGQLADKTARENLELREKCALQAMKIFNDPYYKAEDRNKSGTNVGQSHQSHYNTELKKCFMTTRLITTLASGTTFSEDLLDAYEQREYASYMWIASEAKDKTNWMVQPKICKLADSLASERECQTHEEYEAFVARYME